MRVFVTGASGWIGSAAITDLVAAGHEVVGLARSDEAAATVSSLGAEVYRGTLEDLDGLRAAAKESDGVVHLGYIHDFSRMDDAAATDRLVIETLGDVLAGTDRPLVVASGVMGLGIGRVVTERDATDVSSHPRSANAVAALALASRGVRSSVVRFAPTVHGAGDHGFAARLVAIARERGVSGYIDEGANHWPAVHRLDAGKLVSLALDSAPAGAVLHGIAEEGVPTRAIAEAIGRGLGLPVISVPWAEAVEHFDWLARFFALDCRASNDLTRELLGWHPTHAGLIEDLDRGAYFQS
ncbi:MAG TPA: SDR family oxidoreductase [Jatrophihabitantaceae bacterium]|nr:SDR family oxidoreductase [Jatrophihabitantaceae bacterium]